MNRQHFDAMKVENEENIFTDKNTGEMWFAKKDNASHKNIKNVLSLCKNLHLDNTSTRLYSSSRLSSRFSATNMPVNVAFRTKASSFLQLNNKLIKETKEELTLDRLNQEVEEELEASLKPPQKNDQYDELNNEANLDRKELANSNGEDHENIIFG
jgi:hypothetical protein